MTQSWQTKLNLQHPVVQAGMGGGLSGARLTAAVSLVGGMGTLGLMPPAPFHQALHETRQRCGDKPFAANLLMPFVRHAHVEACIAERVAVVTMFYGFDRALVQQLQSAGIAVWHQIGDIAQAQQALDDGVDGLIVQGEEAGGHLASRNGTPLAALLPAVRKLTGDRCPLIAAGGIHDAVTAHKARALGADAVAAGTRFLLTPESEAHPAYQQRLLEAQETLRTELFGLAWPAPHRVVGNAATARWCQRNTNGPRWAQTLNRLMIPSRRLLPMDAVLHLVKLQRVGLPLYSPAGLTRDMDPRFLDVTPLYAGRCVREITQLRPAADVVAELAAGFGT
ncbi:MAG: NAD(P)H-dependent flavin oxidoreductase [Stenotrophobium sp.]